MHLASLSWSKAGMLAQKTLVAVLPLGSTEEHGPIGPLGTDFIIPHEMALRIEAKISDRVLILPTLPYGLATTMASFPGTVDIGYSALCDVLKGCVDAVLRCGVKRFLFLNGHGGNTSAIDTASLYLYRKGGQAAEIDWWVLCSQLNKNWQCGHGGGIEGSVAMAVKPDWVHREDLFPSSVAHLGDNLKNVHIHSVQFQGGVVKMVRDVADSIPSGDSGYEDGPEKTDPQLGEEILSAVTDYTIQFIDEFLKIDLERGRKPRTL